MQPLPLGARLGASGGSGGEEEEELDWDAGYGE
jgi:hypothetical protein